MSNNSIQACSQPLLCSDVWDTPRDVRSDTSHAQGALTEARTSIIRPVQSVCAPVARLTTWLYDFSGPEYDTLAHARSLGNDAGNPLLTAVSEDCRARWHSDQEMP